MSGHAVAAARLQQIEGAQHAIGRARGRGHRQIVVVVIPSHGTEAELGAEIARHVFLVGLRMGQPPAHAAEKACGQGRDQGRQRRERQGQD
ncbi:hypothetical protein SBP18_03520 [Rhodoferax ferrireducens]|uniref:hypothetical protein n=1 Tax=Rhodoferax ferrireducens TaxID=192843 RepID=UPI00298DCD42|nr:hypothetical protein [Rhodoferax ferrireducens]WPC67587.1 hypothetical protein SBP18_03520 [Rhodoferax ferrireducens]